MAAGRGAGPGGLHPGPQSRHRRAAVHLADAGGRGASSAGEEHPKALRAVRRQIRQCRLQAYVEKVGNRVKNASELSGADLHLHRARHRRGQRLRPARAAMSTSRAGWSRSPTTRPSWPACSATRSATSPRATPRSATTRRRSGRSARWRPSSAARCWAACLGGSEGARLGGEAGGQLGSTGAAGLCPGLFARAGVRGRPARHPLSRRRRLRSRRHGDLPRDPAGRRRVPAAHRRTAAGGGQLSRRLVPQPSAHARARGPRGRGHQRRAARRARDRPAGAAGGDRRHALRRGPGAGRDRGTQLPHPGLRIAFEAPPGFRLQNSPEAVAGSDGQGRLMLFDMAEGAGGDLRGYLQQGWVTQASACRTCSACS